MGTKSYRTKTEFIERNNGRIKDIWEVALDIGYSSVKLMASDRVASFPSYAKRIDKNFQFASVTPPEAILFKDNDNGEMWLVGEVAQNIMESGDTSDSETALYGRERYNNPMFKVITKCGLGIGLMGNKENAKLVVQTGLPERYMSDEPELKEALSGKHSFSIKIGTGAWQNFEFYLNINDIYVMSQPKGTLFSVCIDKNGKFHSDAQKYLSSSIIVFDPGFGTLDIFPIISGVVGKGETYADLGMKRILQETTRLIKENYEIDIPVPAMQKYLGTGVVRYVNKKKLQSKEYSFDQFLSVASTKVCDEAIARVMSSIKLIDYNYMIITGGTGAAWLSKIESKFKDFDTLKLIKGNQNDNLSFIYSNVRGYFLYRYNKLGKELEKKGA